MQVFTIKAKPKAVFGGILAITGIIVVILTFVGNHSASVSSSASVSCKTNKERVEYIQSLGYETDGKETSKEVTIPTVFNDVYNRYNDIQKKQDFDLSKYKGKTVTLYTYSITNYKNNKNVIADLMVYDGVLIGADLCDTSAKDGFLVELK